MKTCAAIAFVAKQDLAVADLKTLFARPPTSADEG
jgi:hypothetical protein